MSDIDLLRSIDGVPDDIDQVVITGLNFQTICAESEEPDNWELEIKYWPKEKLLETVSVREYLNSYRDDVMLVEEVGQEIIRDLFYTVHPSEIYLWAKVEPTSSPNQEVGWNLRDVQDYLALENPA